MNNAVNRAQGAKKKQYITPSTEVQKIEMICQLLSASGMHIGGGGSQTGAHMPGKPVCN